MHHTKISDHIRLDGLPFIIRCTNSFKYNLNEAKFIAQFRTGDFKKISAKHLLNVF